ncbi:MAG: Uncharacterised protein [Polaribacter sejongensis]|nr:MAG: Uncharacterised protein [Polaribacter sejongensis]
MNSPNFFKLSPLGIYFSNVLKLGCPCIKVCKAQSGFLITSIIFLILILGGIANPLRISRGLYPNVGTSAKITNTSVPAAAALSNKSRFTVSSVG